MGVSHLQRASYHEHARFKRFLASELCRLTSNKVIELRLKNIQILGCDAV